MYFPGGSITPTAATTWQQAPGPNGYNEPAATEISTLSLLDDRPILGPEVDSKVISGMVTYNFFNNGTCTAGTNNVNLLSSQTVSLAAGLVPYSIATGTLASGDYAFQVVYCGYSYYNDYTNIC